jgi:hypothetical protein|tara:strand:- start:298 stop:543 length:246 start_codon:yes stop_codon:yes gene_type:complete
MITALAIQALVVTQARLPSILAVLMHDKGMVHSAIPYAKSIALATSIGLPTPLATSPDRIKRNIALAISRVMQSLLLSEPI